MSDSNQSGESTGVDCTQLEKYLKAGMWKMADLETRKLLYLSCGLGPTDQTVLSIPQIPCDDFQKIDQYWVKYSKGRFGFSVQRTIWLPVVRKFYEKTDAWAAFGDRVGWRINNLFKRNYWKPMKELTYSLDAPAGHLPHLGDRFGITTMEAFANHVNACAQQVPE